MKTITVGQGYYVRDFFTKQKGYGRQAIYLRIASESNMHEEHTVYANDVFPNVQEHYDFLLEEDSFYREENDTYTDSNGNEYEKSMIFESTIDFLNSKFKGESFEIESDNEE